MHTFNSNLLLLPRESLSGIAHIYQQALTVSADLAMHTFQQQPDVAAANPLFCITHTTTSACHKHLSCNTHIRQQPAVAGVTDPCPALHTFTSKRLP
jgi:hypothetical protein